MSDFGVTLIEFSSKKFLKFFKKIVSMLFRLTARLQLYSLSLLYHSKYDNFRHILYKISEKIAKVKRPRFGTSDLFCKIFF